VHVDIAERRQFDHPLWNDAAIGNYDDGVGPNLLELRSKLCVVLDLFRLRHGNAVRECDLLYGSWCEFQASSLGAVRLRNYELHVVALANERFETSHGEHRSSAEDELHQVDGTGVK
jgi:hypothetical protein